MTLEQLKVFVKVVDCGGFTRAADLLEMQRSNVSRVIAQLEAELGVQLLERTTRTQSITEAGRAVYERALGVLEAIEDTRRVTQSIQEEPRGLLRLTCGVEFGMVALGAWIEQYAARYPHVAVEAEYTSRELDIVHEGFDLAIRAGPLPESRLVARRLGQLDYGLFAGPGYAEASGLPASPQELNAHSLVVFTGGSPKPAWVLREEGAGAREAFKFMPQGRLRVNAGTAVRNALVNDLGIGLLPCVIAQPLVVHHQLLPVLPRWRPPPVELYAVFPSNRFLTPKVRAFVDLALERLPLGEVAGA